MAATSSKTPQQMSQKEQQKLLDGLNVIRAELRELVTRKGQLESEIYDHSSVLNTLEKVPKDRKCYRMLGGILMEQKVQDVAPDLEKEIAKFKALFDETTKKMEEKEKQFNDYAKDNKLVFVDSKNMVENNK